LFASPNNTGTAARRQVVSSSSSSSSTTSTVDPSATALPTDGKEQGAVSKVVRLSENVRPFDDRVHFCVLNFFFFFFVSVENLPLQGFQKRGRQQTSQSLIMLPEGL